MHDEAYMDEVFHVSQTRAYCESWRAPWNPSITTFPGMYWIAAFVFRCLHVECSVSNLRMLNSVFAIGLALTLVSILGSIRRSLFIFTFPPLFFFYLLYYTDVASLLFVVLTWHCHNVQKPWLAGLCGAIAVLMRQNNIIWVCAFVLGDVLKDVCVKGFWWSLRRIPVYLTRYTVQVLVLVSFAAFLVWNEGSTVLGHKTFHQNSLHASQMAYFALLLSITCLPLTNLRLFKLFVRRNVMLLLFATVFCLWAFRYSFTVHPFLLADNRHYMFYLFRRVLVRNSWLRFALAPLFGLCIVHVVFLAQALTLSHAVALFTGSFLHLAFAPLVEVRYFVLPIVLFLLAFFRAPPPKFAPASFVSNRALVASVAFLLCQSVLLHIFLNRTFVYADGSVGRFMF
jgi:alpha-1,2-glucosyltransferase